VAVSRHDATPLTSDELVYNSEDVASWASVVN